MLKVLDLFSGIGGFSLGLERTGGFETVAFCEIEEFPRKVLRKHWPGVPIFEDVRELTGEQVGPVDVICGGYPCQPFSLAGNRQGAEDDRHLWPEFHRLVDELRPAWVIGENVFGHISMGLDEVLSDLEGSGYACRPFVIPACAVDAPHRRDRVWTIAHSGDFLQPPGLADREDTSSATRSERSHQREGEAYDRERIRVEPCSSGEALADADDARSGTPQHGADRNRTAKDQRKEHKSQRGFGGRSETLAHAQSKYWRAGLCKNGTVPGKRFESTHGSRWLPEPAVGRVAHGVPRRVDRLKSLGNAVVPQIPELIGRAILEAEQ